MTNLEKYEGKLKEISQESSRMAWSSWMWAFLFLVLIVIILTVLITIFATFANMLAMLFIFVAEGILLFIPVLLYYHRAGNYMKNICLELENTHPGIYDAYEEWKQKAVENLPDSF